MATTTQTRGGAVLITGAAAIAHALTSHSPRTRYLAGQGARMVVFLRLLPDRMRDRLLLRAFGLANIQPGS